MEVQYIKLKRTTKSFSEIATPPAVTTIKAGEPLVINNTEEGQYLLLGGNVDGTVSSDTKVIKTIPKTHADNYVFTVETADEKWTIKIPNAIEATAYLTNNTTGQAGKVANVLTFSDDGDGTVADNADYDGSQNGVVISYNTVGALGAVNTNASGAANNTVWFKQNGGTPDASLRNKIWIDTSDGVSKYWEETANNNNGAWVPLPVAYT